MMAAVVSMGPVNNLSILYLFIESISMEGTEDNGQTVSLARQCRLSVSSISNEHGQYPTTTVYDTDSLSHVHSLDIV